MSSSSIPIVVSIIAVNWFAVEAAWEKSKHKSGKHVYAAPLGFKLLNIAITPTLIYGAATILLRRSGDWWVSMILLGTVVLIISAFPATLIVSSEGVTSVKLFGLHKRFIRWTDVEAIYENPEDSSLVIIDRAHHRIVHTTYNVDRNGFTHDIEAHSPRAIHRVK